MSHPSYDYKKHWTPSNYGAGTDHQWDTHIHKFLKPGSVLDIGCGAGRFAETLTKGDKYKDDYLGIDISLAAVTTAAAEHPGLKFEAHDIVEWEPDQTFDNIFTWTTLEHLPHEVMAAVAEKLKKLGKNIIIGEPYEKDADDSTWAAHCHNHNYRELFDVVDEIDLGSIKVYQARGI